MDAGDTAFLKFCGHVDQTNAGWSRTLGMLGIVCVGGEAKRRRKLAASSCRFLEFCSCANLYRDVGTRNVGQPRMRKMPLP